MSFMTLCLFISCSVSLCYVFAQVTSSSKTLQFTLDGNYVCKISKDTINITTNENFTVSVTSPFALVKADCFVSNKLILDKNDFKDGQFDSHVEKSADKIHNGQWNCRFRAQKGSEKPEIHCKNITVNVIDPKSDKSGIPTMMYIIIGCVVGAVVLIIIIVQTICICHYRSKVAGPNELSRLERPPTQNNDTARYSSMPLRKSSRRKRESSGIYQSLENLSTVQKTPPPPNIKDRPPMPLPTFTESDDDSTIYADGNTLTRMFTPEPPPIDSLPRNKKGKYNKPKPMVKPKPVQTNLDDMEDYDYADSDAHMNRQLIKKPMPMHPRPEKATKPVPRNGSPHKVIPKQLIPPKCAAGGAPVMSELDNILRQRKLKAAESRAPDVPSPESASPGSHHQMARRGPAPRESPSPQQVRGLKTPPEKEIRPQPKTWTSPVKLPIDPRPQLNQRAQDRSQGQRYYPEENSRRPEMKPQHLPDRLEERSSPARPLFIPHPDVARTPLPVRMPSTDRLTSPPLPRKPGPGTDSRAPVLPARRPLPPPPDAESVYEPVAEAESGSSDDEEWNIEPLKPYNIYNI